MFQNQEDLNSQGLEIRLPRAWGSSATFVGVGFALSLGIVSCGPKMAPYVPPKAAPTSQESAGLLVRLDSAESVTRLLEHPGARLRPLHPPTFFYEVGGLSESEIRRLAPDLVWIVPNKYHSGLNMNRPIRGLSTLLGKLGCEGTSTSPMAEIVPPTGLSDARIFKRPSGGGARITLQAKKAVNAPTGLGLLWLTNAPDGSKANIDPSPSQQLSLPLDLMGEYQILLVSKTKQNICSASSLRFGVTDNIPYQGKKAPRPFTDEDRERFLHLRVLQAEDAWKIGRGKGVKVAIVDTGVAYNHPDLAQNIATSSVEIPGNKIDDDRNGFIDDAYGFDFANGDSFPLDDAMHGTHVAGLTASAVSGVAPEASILAVKVLNTFGGADSGSTIAAVKYAADQNSNIINLSLGGYSDSPELKAAWLETLAYANSRGALVVAAAGNGDDEGKSVNIDQVQNIPGGLIAPNLITIASIGLDGKLAPYSNYGLKNVSLAAPGGAPQSPTNKFDGGLLSAYYEPSVQTYVKSMGTSMASPVASGVLALVASMVPGATSKQIKDHVMKTALPVKGLSGLMNVGGTVHALRAMQSLKGRDSNTPLNNTPPPRPTNSNWRPRMRPGTAETPISKPRLPSDPSYGLDPRPRTRR